jgi:hypothetical protein
MALGAVLGEPRLGRAASPYQINRFRISSFWATAAAALWAAVMLAAAAAPASNPDAATARRLFADPPREYATAPLWVWNDQLTEDQVRDTLRDLAAQRVRQVFVHPRPGLMTPYLSPDWFRLWKVALAEAERLDMNCWIYDENSYPSGFAGGEVPEQMPESRGRGLHLRAVDKAPKWDEATLAVFGLDGAQATDVSAAARAGTLPPTGRYLTAVIQRAPNRGWHGGRSYVDLLYPGVTQKFLDVTLEAYRREVGGQFGRRIPGSFTDEPEIRPAGGLPWTDDLPAQFQQRCGYSLLASLASLSQEVGDWRKVRHDYFHLLNALFIERWAQPYYEWCAKHGLAFTGHYWDHSWPKCTGVPDNMAMAAWQQIPGIDCLMNQYREDTHAQFGNIRMVRELASVANQLGRTRTLCEIYGAGGWDLRFEDMKRIGDWLGVLGVNLFDEHLSYVTLRGARKRDHPQSFSYHEPWWEAYHVNADYLTRLSCALAQGRQVNRILVLEPTTTAWMYQGNEARLKELGDAFCNLLQVLEAAQVEYDLGDEDIIARHGVNAGTELVVGQGRYTTVVLPPGTENLDAPTVKLLDGFLRAGGAVLCAGEPPARVDGAVSPRGATLAAAKTWQRVEPAAITERLRATGNADGFAISRTAGDRGILFHQRRQLADGELLLLVNTSSEHSSAGTVATGRAGIEQWDLYTGKTRAWSFAKTARGVTTEFRLPPSGSLLLFLSKAPLKPAPAAKETVTTLAASGPMEIRRVAPNVLTLDHVDVTAGGETKRDIYFYQGNQFAFQKNGVERNPWDSAVQFRDELIKRTFPAGSGFEASYRFTIAEKVPADLAIVIERPDLYTVTCNGQSVAAKAGDWWLDKAFGRIVLAAAARVGENVVTVRAAPFTLLHELEPAYVLGSFTVQPAAKGFVLAPERPLQAGRWNEQGLPFYSAGVAYRVKFDVPERAGRAAVALPAWYGSVAKVLVNGRPAGYVTAPPWECDVTDLVARGANTVEVVVIGTLKNTLGPHHGKQPPGSAWPRMFQTGPKGGLPPGADYDTIGYGLFEPFALKLTKP